MKNIKQKLLFGIIIIFFIFNMLPVGVYGAVNLWGTSKPIVQQGLGFDAAPLDPIAVVVNVIRLLLTFLGIVAVIIILYAGWLWMIAGGNEENVKKSKALMLNAAIGLLIILAAFGIVNWVLARLTEVVSQTP